MHNAELERLNGQVTVFSRVGMNKLTGSFGAGRSARGLGGLFVGTESGNNVFGHLIGRQHAAGASDEALRTAVEAE